MKKFLFIFLSIVLVSGVYAQEFKLIGGANLSKYNASGLYWILSDESSSEWKYKTGFLMGGGVEFSLIKKISIEIDALFFQKGSNIEHRDLIYHIKSKENLNVISIPILLRIKSFNGSSPYILGGCELSLILPHEENTKNFDCGLVFGGGFEMKLSKVSLFIEGRYHLGLIDIQPGQPDYKKTRTVAIIFGFKI